MRLAYCVRCGALVGTVCRICSRNAGWEIRTVEDLWLRPAEPPKEGMNWRRLALLLFQATLAVAIVLTLITLFLRSTQ